jgi:hypothetical protein
VDRTPQREVGMQTQVTISDADRGLDFRLEVACDYFPATRPHWGWRHGGEPGEAARVELQQVRCLEVVIQCGRVEIAANPRSGDSPAVARQVGEWCRTKYADEITQAVLDQINAAHPGALGIPRRTG